MSDYYAYSFVRTDLPIDQQIIQHGHAVHEASNLPNNNRYDGTTPNAVLFQVKNEEELALISRKLREDPYLLFAMFYERDYDRGFTALTTVPIHKTDSRRDVFVGYELYGRPSDVPSSVGR